VFGGLQVYLGQQVRPDDHSFKNLETAFLDISAEVGGWWLCQAMADVLIVANIGAGLSRGPVFRTSCSAWAAMACCPGASSRMSALAEERRRNICLVALLSFVGTLVLNHEQSAELINFGVFLAFMGVNAEVVRQFWFLEESGRRSVSSQPCWFPDWVFSFA
jgi:putrescine importer